MYFPTVQIWTVGFEISSTDVEGEEAGYRRISKLRSWRREYVRESEEVLVGLESVFDE